MSRARSLGTAGALALVLSTGCVLPSRGVRTGRPVTAADVARIVPGSTTKARLFSQLGAPTAIVGANEVVSVSSVITTERFTSAGPLLSDPWGVFPLQGDAALELFAGRTALGPGHRVYHYLSARNSGAVGVFILVGFETRKTTVDELWVLVDEGTELVEGVVFRPGADGG